MESKVCSKCNIEKKIKQFYKIYAESSACNRKRGTKRHHQDKYKISNQRKIFDEKNEDNVSHQQNDSYIQFKDLV